MMSKSLGDKITELLNFLSRRTVPGCGFALMTPAEWKEFLSMERDVFGQAHRQGHSIPESEPPKGFWPSDLLRIGWRRVKSRDLQGEPATKWMQELNAEQAYDYAYGTVICADQRWIDQMATLRSRARATNPHSDGVSDRLAFDASTSLIELDGVAFGPCASVPFKLLEALWKNHDKWPIRGESLQKMAKVSGKNLAREFRSLPKPLSDIIHAQPGAGHRLVLPDKS